LFGTNTHGWLSSSQTLVVVLDQRFGQLLLLLLMKPATASNDDHSHQDRNESDSSHRQGDGCAARPATFAPSAR